MCFAICQICFNHTFMVKGVLCVLPFINVVLIISCWLKARALSVLPSVNVVSIIMYCHLSMLFWSYSSLQGSKKKIMLVFLKLYCAAIFSFI